MTESQINLWFDIFKVLLFALVGTGTAVFFVAAGYAVFTLNKDDKPKIGKGLGL